MNGETLLSKWWQTDSCRQACERADKAKADRIARMKRALAERKETLQREVEQWEEAT